jgi:hypothetical protein
MWWVTQIILLITVGFAQKVPRFIYQQIKMLVHFILK